MYEIVRAKLAEMTTLRYQLEAEILADPKLLSAPAGHPAKIMRASLRDQVRLLRSLIADADHA